MSGDYCNDKNDDGNGRTPFCPVTLPASQNKSTIITNNRNRNKKRHGKKNEKRNKEEWNPVTRIEIALMTRNVVLHPQWTVVAT